ncbi:MAG TPA: VIT domain-containing protein [Candidatus Eremiobacteraeota bacterium]|nr:VIT domain-containing protein [Candidatus Eremiobacteraeota bacterium]
MIRDEIFFMGRKITEGTVIPVDLEGYTLPLKYTEVRASIIGLLADVTVTQKFHNSLSKNIEVVYVFPLPHESAVNDLEIKIEKRIIKAEVKEREEARKTYEEARDEGKKAGLLEQERPNIFTMSVANIEPGQEILVTLRYHETVKYEDGEYEFVFPMTITPRYTGDEKEPTVSDAERITPPIEETSHREVNIFVNLDAGFPIGEIKSPTHLLYTQEKNENKREIQLAKEGEIPNKDFILKYSSKGEQLETSLSFYRKEGKPGTFMLHLTPKFDYGPEEMVKREMIFVLDRSGSMSYGSGAYGPMEQAKDALKSCLRTLRAGDTFAIITFDTTMEYLSKESLEFNEENLKKAENFIDATYARGGTDIYRAMECALTMPVNKLYLRQIVFLTDGAVGNEEEILREIQKMLGKSRIFTFGIGPSVNRYLLDKMAQMGRGTAQYIQLNQNIEEAIQKFANQTAFPILCDINMEWKGIKVADLYPALIPDLYFGQVLYVLGRFYTDGKATATLKSRTVAGEFNQDFSVELPEKSEDHPILETIWARKRIESLLDREREKPKEKFSIRDEIIGLAMKYNLMSPYTSLVAVEKIEGEEGEKEKKEIIRIDVPSILPEGLNYDAFLSQSPPGGMGSGISFGAPMFQSMASMAPTPSPSPVFRSMGGGGSIKVDLLSCERKSFSLNLENVVDGIGDVVGGAIDGVKSMLSRSRKDKAQVAMQCADMDIKDEMRSGKDAVIKPSPAPMVSCPMPAPAKSEIPFGIETPLAPETGEIIFKWLVRNQTAEGFFSEETDLEKKIISTALAALAFIGQGHTDKTGKYKPQIGKALTDLGNNLEKVSGLAIALSTWVFLELYNLSGKKKEQSLAEKAVKRLKDLWPEYKTPVDCFFAGIAGKGAIKSGLCKEEDLPDAGRWISEGKGSTKEVTQISSETDLMISIMNVMSGKEELHKSYLNLLGKYYISQGKDTGSIKFPWAGPLDSTSAGIFIILLTGSKLMSI